MLALPRYLYSDYLCSQPNIKKRKRIDKQEAGSGRIKWLAKIQAISQSLPWSNTSCLTATCCILLFYFVSILQDSFTNTPDSFEQSNWKEPFKVGQFFVWPQARELISQLKCFQQISEWSVKHPTERILDIDLPLSYGIFDPVRDPCALNVVSFKWDPSRWSRVTTLSRNNTAKLFCHNWTAVKLRQYFYALWVCICKFAPRWKCLNP